MENVMKFKVHWLIDGVVEIDAKNSELAEQEIKKITEKFISKNSDFFIDMGAKAVQGQAYLPGLDEK